MVKKVKNMAFSHNSLIINRLRVTHCKSISYTISYKYINNCLEIWNIFRNLVPVRELDKILKIFI